LLCKISSYLKIRIIAITIIFLGILNKTHAQDPLFSQFMFNQLYFNPAFAGNTQYPRIIGGYRNQWPGLNNAYSSYYASFDHYFESLNGGVGLAITRDVQGNGVFSKTSFDVMYSYPVELNKNMSANLGLQASVVQKNVNGSKVLLGDQNPFTTSPPLSQEIIPDQSKIYPDFSAGISFLYKEQYQINLSVHHLNTPNEMAGSSYIFLSPLRFTIQVMAQYPSKKTNRERERLFFKPGIMTQFQKTNNSFEWGSNLLYSSLIGGLWFRNNASLTLNSFILLAGYSQSGFSLYYSYDFWFPGNYQTVKNYGAHEVTFIYLFQYNDPRKKMRTIKCPNF
jgi:type IX secretion system PorP/SprF family membrane protein